MVKCDFVQVLESCSKVLEYFVGDAKSIRSRCLTARDTLVDKLVERYRHAMTSFFEEVCWHCYSDTNEVVVTFLRATAYMLYRVYVVAILSVWLSLGWISQQESPPVAIAEVSARQPCRS